MKKECTLIAFKQALRFTMIIGAGISIFEIFLFLINFFMSPEYAIICTISLYVFFGILMVCYEDCINGCSKEKELNDN